MPWVTKPLASVTHRIGGGTPARERKDYWGGDIPWFTVADLQDVEDIQCLSTSRESITEAGLANSAAKLVPEGAVIFSARVVVGKVGIAKNAMATNQDFSTFVPCDGLDREFLAYFLIKAKGDLRSHQRGATIKGVTTKVLDALEVPLPPLPEQRRIVGRIKEFMARVKEVEELKNSSRIQQQYLSASLIESELHPDLTGAEGWTTRTIGDLVTTVRNGKSIAQDTEGLADGAVLTLTAVRSFDLGISFQKPIVLPNQVAKQFRIDAGDVFVSRANTIELVGLSAVAMEAISERLIYPDLLIKLKVDPTLILPRYLAYALRSASSRKQIKARALGSSQTMVKISGERLREISVPVPSLIEQAKIVGRLDAAHDLMRHLAVESLSGEVEVLRGAILRKAFAGEL
ncbi:restriction endonuclease subunit S [Pseudomonas sp. I3-I5]|uniref:restriction endonuclease subunit S n=1 Tax=Pseudomonas sp. I3-I5 TaxID=2926671 RepID=UPI001F5FF6BB|nr:restriction endonuclease subunit S [Pseudomonas sp. I3-I5]UNT14094.1 restriction endonuclease subunit S [Pseudomonas sp. I3-I5]